MFVDTHCHLPMVTQQPLEAVVHDAAQVGVEKIITVSITLQNSVESIAVAKQFAGVYATVGIHPCDCSHAWRQEFKEIEALCKEKKANKIVALGETGLDFYHKPFDKQRQIDAFTAHIECALTYELPIVVHIRESVDEVLRVLEEYKRELRGNTLRGNTLRSNSLPGNVLRGVAHCFVQEASVARTLCEWGFYLGIGGPISYPKNDLLRETIKNVPLENLVLETDAPFLPPQQFRGKKNHPKYIPLIAKEIADLKGVEVGYVESVTTANAVDLFSLT